MAKLEMVSRTHTGMVRANNEDYTYISTREGIAVLADGMGGHRGGEVASQMAVEVAVEEMRYSLKFASSDQMQCLMQVGQAMESANAQVHSLSVKRPELKGMGTTLVLTLFSGDKLYYAHVGDSRLYRYRDNELTQLTKDHSLMQEVIDSEIFPNRGSARRAGVGENVLTRSMGNAKDVDVDLDLTTCWPSDIYLLCSDGLFGFVDESDLLAILAEKNKPLERKADSLLLQALAAGGRDNVSLVLVQPGTNG